MKISICIVVKNRSKINYKEKELILFPNLVKGLAAIKKDHEIELVICDFQSDDWPLKDWIYEYSDDFKITLIENKEEFSKGMGYNICAKKAANELLFFCDADILIGEGFFENIEKCIDSGKIWFPIVKYIEESGVEVFRTQNGQGLCLITKTNFNKTDGWPEFYSWGGEDHLFYYKCHALFKIERNQCEFLKHQWHPVEYSYKYYKNPVQSCFNKHYRKK